MHLGGPLPCGRVTPIARHSWPRDRAALPGRPASLPIRVTVVSLIRSRPSSCKRQPQGPLLRVKPTKN